MISILAGWMFRVPHQAGSRRLIVIPPFQSANFRLSSPRGDGEFYDRLHRDLRAPVAALEVLAQPGKLVGGRSPRAFPGLADQPQLAAGGLCLLDDLGTHRKLPDTLGALRTTPIQMRSLMTVAGPAPCARRD